MIKHIIDAVKGKHPLTKRRSSHWRKVRKAHLANHPKCAVCGGTKKLEVHHIRPFHLYPHLELEPSNLITLCESKRGGLNCHLAIGHLGYFRSFNTGVTGDSSYWNNKLETRP